MNGMMMFLPALFILFWLAVVGIALWAVINLVKAKKKSVDIQMDAFESLRADNAKLQAELTAIKDNLASIDRMLKEID